MARSISVLELTQSNVKIRVDDLVSILDKVGSRPFVLYSINGGSRKGKSYMMNVILQYLNCSTRDENWFRPESLDSTFTWSGGSERVTEGINMWSEPFVTRDKDGREICILLMDTQGNFDDRTSTHHNALVFAFSVLISSVLIWNEMTDISDDVLQFFQCFLGYAKLTSEELEDEMGAESENSQIFQRLIFLLRDFAFRDYPFGYHDDSTGTEQNFKISRLNHNPRRADEQNFMRSQILSSFKDVGIFALPHPGLQLAVYDVRDNLEPNFKTFTKQFVELIFSPEKLSTKHVGGVEVTGNDFKVFVRRWAQQFASTELPQMQNIMATNVEIQNTIALRNAAEFYDTEMRKIITSNPEGLEEALIQVGNEELIARALSVYLKTRKLGNKETQAEYCENLRITLKDKFNHYEQLNLINVRTAEERVILLNQKKSLEDVITLNEVKLDKLSKDNEADRKKFNDDIEAAKTQSEAIQKQIIANSEARLAQINQQAKEQREAFMSVIEEAKRKQEELQQEMARQMQVAAEEKQQLQQSFTKGRKKKKSILRKVISVFR